MKAHEYIVHSRTIGHRVEDVLRLVDIVLSVFGVLSEYLTSRVLPT